VPSGAGRRGKTSTHGPIFKMLVADRAWRAFKRPEYGIRDGIADGAIMCVNRIDRPSDFCIRESMVVRSDQGHRLDR